MPQQPFPSSEEGRSGAAEDWLWAATSPDWGSVMSTAVSKQCRGHLRGSSLGFPVSGPRQTEHTGLAGMYFMSKGMKQWFEAPGLPSFLMADVSGHCSLSTNTNGTHPIPFVVCFLPELIESTVMSGRRFASDASGAWHTSGAACRPLRWAGATHTAGVPRALAASLFLPQNILQMEPEQSAACDGV